MTKTWVYKSSGWRRVTDDAGFYPSEIGVLEPVRIAFEDPVAIEENGYIYALPPEAIFSF